MASLNLDHVSLHYPIATPRARSIKSHVISTLGGKIGEANSHLTVVESLRDISLQLRDGDRIGLVGHNGAGKSTMLRVMGGIYEPTFGSVRVQGKISSFVDITLGMDPESTGWDNIVLRGVMLGLTFEQARAISAEVADFSELGEYLDMPVRTYSAGMFMRLAFAVTTSIRPDIVLMDEMIGAGDAKFLDKATSRIREMISDTKILVLASHSPNIIRTFCDKAVWLEKGQVRNIGDVESILKEYADSVGATPI